MTKCSKEEAIDNNFGGIERDNNMMTMQYCTSAYMLVYLRVSELQNVLQEITINNIPKEVSKYDL